MAHLHYYLSKKAKDTNKVEILLRFRHNEIDLRAKSRIWIPADKWDTDKAEIIATDRNRSKQSQQQEAELLKAKAELDTIKNLIYNDFWARGPQSISKDWLKNLIDNYYTKPEEDKNSLVFSNLFEEFLTAHNYSTFRYRQYRVFERSLRRFSLQTSTPIDLAEFTPETIAAFERFLRNEHLNFAQDNEGTWRIIANKFLYEAEPDTRPVKPRGDNTISCILTKFNTFYRWAIEKKGLAISNPFVKYSIPAEQYGTPYYITIEERNQIYKADLHDQSLLKEKHDPEILENQRNIFIFQCCVGCRIGDLYRLTKKNISRGFLEYSPHKTQKSNLAIVRVPLTGTAKEILEKYKEFQARDKAGRLFPFIAEQTYNIFIKDIFTLAGITRKVAVLNPLTKETELRPLNEIASSHLARRTFVGNLYKSVQDPNLIGSMSGHAEGSRAFARYRQIDDELKVNVIKALE